MAHQSRHGWSTRMMALVCLCSYVSACHSWHTQPVSPQQVLAQNPSEVRVMRTDSSKLVLKAPRIANDTLHGVGRDSQEVFVSLQQVDSLQVKRPNTGKTVGLVGLFVVGIGAVIGYEAYLAVMNED